MRLTKNVNERSAIRLVEPPRSVKSLEMSASIRKHYGSVSGIERAETRWLLTSYPSTPREICRKDDFFVLRWLPLLDGAEQVVQLKSKESRVLADDRREDNVEDGCVD